MKITKIGHCCLLIEEKGLVVLTDPGAYSTGQKDLTGIDIVLITHEHADHLHVDSLKIILKHNPKAEVITNAAVGAILKKEGIACTLLVHGGSLVRKGVSLAGFGEKHEYIYETVPAVENTGYFIADKLFYPGDAFFDPQKPIDVLALPVAGPWLTISDSIEYAKKLKPRIAFPVHDGMLMAERLGPVHRLPEAALKPYGVEFKPLIEGAALEC